MALKSLLLALTVAVLLSLQGGSPPALADAARRHSGTVVKVDPQTGTLVLEELGAAGKKQLLQVKVPAEARILFSERIPDNQVTDLSQPFKETRINLSQVRPGDFATVELTEKAVAGSVTVTLGRESR
jgi:hypothetical protein